MCYVIDIASATDTCRSVYCVLQLDLPGHKLSHSLEGDTDSEVLRVPVAMAMTKLLLVLPEEKLHSHLPK